MFKFNNGNNKERHENNLQLAINKNSKTIIRQ